ncbi:MAG: hypothetical protein R2838_20665 [Caldilineaceae bacterium]
MGYREQGVETSMAAIAVAETSTINAPFAAPDLLASNYWKAGMMTEGGKGV